MKKDKLFIYGTLMGEHKEKIYELPLKMYDLGSFPALVYDNKVNKVAGVIVEVDPKQWEELDRYEGVANGLYTREILVIDDEEVFVYIGSYGLGASTFKKDKVPESKVVGINSKDEVYCWRKSSFDEITISNIGELKDIIKKYPDNTPIIYHDSSTKQDYSSEMAYMYFEDGKLNVWVL